MADKNGKPKSTSVDLKVVEPKKGSCRFSLPKDATGIVTNIYVDRLEAMKQLGIEDLDKLAGVRITIEPITKAA